MYKLNDTKIFEHKSILVFELSRGIQRWSTFLNKYCMVILESQSIVVVWNF